MRLLCDFANEDEDGEPFIHPVVRAILLHFWLAYDHPFEDGNGRTARILFFWLMQQRGYWLIEYLPISPIIRKAPAKYGARLHRVRDRRRRHDLLPHSPARGDREGARSSTTSTSSARSPRCATSSDCCRAPTDSTTASWRCSPTRFATRTAPTRSAVTPTSHRVTHETARSDLADLNERGLLLRRSKGRGYIFEPAPDLAERLKESPA